MTTDNFLTSAEYLKQRALTVPALPVHPATEATAVIVPVLGRPHHAKTFMDSLKASNAPLAKVYAVVDEIEDIEVIGAWQSAGAEIVWGSWWEEGPEFDGESFKDERPGSFAEKVNLAYTHTNEPWLFLAGSDVQFHRQWLDYAQDASRDGAHVIGTNDMHNDSVVFGLTSTHLLIRRYYIEQRGASWDGPGIVCHEGYRHMGPDSEIVTLAQQRNVWAFARHSKVEHFHPFWGGAPIDDTYRLGASFHDQDMDLFVKRQAQYA